MRPPPRCPLQSFGGDATLRCTRASALRATLAHGRLVRARAWQRTAVTRGWRGVSARARCGRRLWAAAAAAVVAAATGVANTLGVAFELCGPDAGHRGPEKGTPPGSKCRALQAVAGRCQPLLWPAKQGTMGRREWGPGRAADCAGTDPRMPGLAAWRPAGAPRCAPTPGLRNVAAGSNGRSAGLRPNLAGLRPRGAATCSRPPFKGTPAAGPPPDAHPPPPAAPRPQVRRGATAKSRASPTPSHASAGAPCQRLALDPARVGAPAPPASRALTPLRRLPQRRARLQDPHLRCRRKEGLCGLFPALRAPCQVSLLGLGIGLLAQRSAASHEELHSLPTGALSTASPAAGRKRTSRPRRSRLHGSQPTSTW